MPQALQMKGLKDLFGESRGSCGAQDGSARPNCTLSRGALGVALSARKHRNLAREVGVPLRSQEELQKTTWQLGLSKGRVGVGGRGIEGSLEVTEARTEQGAARCPSREASACDLTAVNATRDQLNMLLIKKSDMPLLALKRQVYENGDKASEILANKLNAICKVKVLKGMGNDYSELCS
ncbi:hypothetical protein NDU88_006193 [Pleurodeles waltl]|uniref:Uncharacterized protein n=1 Tax=Pleurodeles waltl TaxID=8319 RepID=A0AAV7LQ34_PLEWA|nr:hypothetical protein NDU88_006193 [Pleurodeles waltl]